jgi:hypothetical protein
MTGALLAVVLAVASPDTIPSTSPTTSPNARSLRHELAGTTELVSSAPGPEIMNTSAAASPAAARAATPVRT